MIRSDQQIAPEHPWDFLKRGGEMGERIRTFDWSRTPLGPVESWTPAQKNTISLMLANRFPLLLWWGPEYISLYNDAYRPILGKKHPMALGQPVRDCWNEIWHILKPLIDVPFQGGPPTWNDDILLEIGRHGFLEETHFTIAYSPVPDDLTPGGIGGVLATVHEITDKVIGERRIGILKDLGAASLEGRNAKQTCAAAAAVLAMHPRDIPFCLLYLIDADRQGARLAGWSGTAPGEAVAPPVISMTDAAEVGTWPWSVVLRAEETQVVRDLNRRFPAVPVGPWGEPPKDAAVLPIWANVARQPAGFLVAGISARLPFDEHYRNFLDLVASRIGTAVASARAYEAETRRAEALAELDRAKTTFFSNVSHEFRTPLTLMLGPVEELLVMSPSPLPPDAKTQLELVNRNGIRLLRLVNNLLDFSRIEAGRVEARYEPIDLSAFTAELASCFRSAMERAGVTLTVDCAPLTEPVYVDRGMWEKIVLNLISNAFKFTLEGEIEITVRAAASFSSRHVVLTVRDTGVGIPAASIPRLFERFYRVEHARSRSHEGSGIGLALVQELITLHGGTVRVESRAGEGSRFIVTIPFGCAHLPADRIGGGVPLPSIAGGAEPFIDEVLRWLPDTEPVEQALRAPHALPRVGELRASRVLVVDDNADMRNYLARLLAERYEVEAVPDGEAALAAARNARPDVILSDVMMPRLDGFGLLRELRRDPSLQTIPVILLSARAGEESRIEGMEYGADDYLVKPFSARELLARIHAQISMVRVRRESDARFREMADNAPVMIWVTDPTGHCNFLSQSWYDFTGQTPQTGLEFGWIDAVHPDDRRQAQEVFLSASARNEAFRLEYRLLRHDGEYRWAIDAAAPRRAESGAFLGYIGSVIDITERKQAEERVFEAHALLDSLLLSAPIGFCYMNRELRYERINPRLAELNGLSVDAHIGKHVSEIVPSLAETVYEVTNRILSTGRPVINHEFSGDTAAAPGVTRYWNENWYPVYDQAGGVRGFGVVVEDVTERKGAEAALREAQQRLQQWNIKLEQAVNLKTAELVQSQDRLRAMATELNLAEQRERKRLATELHDHLQQTLVLGKLKMGQGKRLTATMPALAQVIEETDAVFSDALQYTRTLVAELSPPVLRDHGLVAGLNWLADYMKRHEVAVTVILPKEDGLKLPEDQSMLLFQSVRELLINSWKHGGTGRATVTMERPDRLLRIEVCDQGAGFDPSIVTLQAGSGVSSKFGLLSIRERMRALGGSFEIQSGPSQGTRAILTLPVAESAWEAERGQPIQSVIDVSNGRSTHPPSPSTATAVGIRVLLVDDHAMVRQGLRSVLDAYDDIQIIGEAQDGVEAVRLTGELRPRVVVMDISMPNMNGIEATAEIKVQYPDTTVIGLSVNADSDNADAMARAGARRLLTKEMAVESLYGAIREAVEATEPTLARLFTA